MDLDHLKEIIKLCHAERVRRIRYEGLELELELPITEDAKNQLTEVMELMAKSKVVTDEDILFDPLAGLKESTNANN